MPVGHSQSPREPPLPPSLPHAFPQWPAHRKVCKKPAPVFVVGLPELEKASPLDDVDKEGAAGLFPGSVVIAPAADPIVLASDIAAYLSESGGAEVRSKAAQGLAGLARASTADALSIVSAEGLLIRVERLVMAGSGGGGGGGGGGDDFSSVADSVALLTAAACSDDARVHARIAGEESLLRALLLMVARGPADAACCGSAAKTLHQLSHSASWEAAARAVEALPADDLKAVIDAAVCGAYEQPRFTLSIVAFLARCARSEAVLRRLLAPNGFLLSLVGLFADEAASEGPRLLAAEVIEAFISVSRGRRVGGTEAFKQLLSPLQVASEHGFPSDVMAGKASRILRVLLMDDKMNEAMALDIPRLVSKVQVGGPNK